MMELDPHPISGTPSAASGLIVNAKGSRVGAGKQTTFDCLVHRPDRGGLGIGSLILSIMVCRNEVLKSSGRLRMLHFVYIRPRQAHGCLLCKGPWAGASCLSSQLLRFCKTRESSGRWKRLGPLLKIPKMGGG